MRKPYAMSAVAIAAIVSMGCGSTPDHSNTLIFGTNTTLALDAGTDPASAQTPHVTLGYKRQEAVWMPLWANTARDTGDQRRLNPAAGPANADPKFQSEQYSENGRRDTYSVLATFRAQFNGRSTRTEASGGAGLAQFFATGIAAQKLAEQGGAALVSVQPGKAAFDHAVQQEAKRVTKMQTDRAERVVQYLYGSGDTLDEAKLSNLVDCLQEPTRRTNFVQDDYLDELKTKDRGDAATTLQSLKYEGYLDVLAICAKN